MCSIKNQMTDKVNQIEHEKTNKKNMCMMKARKLFKI